MNLLFCSIEHHAMNTYLYYGVAFELRAFFTSALDEGRCVPSRSGCRTSGQKPRYPFNRKLECCGGKKIFYPCREPIQCVDKPTRCINSYKWPLFFIVWLYIVRALTRPSSGASSSKLCHAFGTFVQASLAAASTQQLDLPDSTNVPNAWYTLLAGAPDDGRVIAGNM